MSEVSSSVRQLAHNFLQGVSVYWEKRLIFIFLMGFASGLPFLLSGATLSIWLTEAGVSLTAIGLFALVGTPYNLKYLWAPFIDRVPIPILSKMLGRRRAWMLVIQVGLMLSIIALGLTKPQTAPEMTAFFALAVAFFSASQDIVIDAYRIEILDEDQQGAGAAMTQAGYRFGLLAAGAGALYLASNMAFGRTWLSAMSGWVAEQTDWAAFFVISTFVALPGLLMLLWMMKRLPMSLQAGQRE